MERGQYLEMAMREALAIFMGCLIATFVISLLLGSYFWIRASFNRRRPSQRWFVHTNPLNAVLFEDELMPQGLKYRVVREVFGSG
jgi:hypothetical protein